MLERGFCPSGRLFEAAACETPVLSDAWPGVDEFFEPDREILIAYDSADALRAMELDPLELKRIGRAASRRARECHTAAIRARQMVNAIEAAAGDRGSQAVSVSGDHA